MVFRHNRVYIMHTYMYNTAHTQLSQYVLGFPPNTYTPLPVIYQHTFDNTANMESTKCKAQNYVTDLSHLHYI